MKAKKRFLSLLLCGAMLFSLCPQAAFAEGAEAGGLCEHHPQHTAECGYTEGSEGTPCSHEHTEDCYTLVTECVHEHGPECYPEENAGTAETESVSGNIATPSEPEEQEPSACTHVCSEESGCITKKLDCQHEHNEACGYAPTTEGTSCGYVCEICNPQDSSEAEETEPEAECVCTELCTEETVNADCPVCGAEGADLTACEGMEAEIATLSNALAAEPNATAGAFEVTEGTLNKDYSYSNGVLTVQNGADITISMADGATTPTSDRIVVNGNAEITLNGVNITGAAYDSINGTDAQSPIDVSENTTLILNLLESSQNILTGGEGKASVGAPGIHVPDSASLVIYGKGGLSVTGGTSTNTYGGNGIGGISFGGSSGESSGSVIILATGNVTVTGGDGQGTTSDGVDIGGGLGTIDGGNGQGIRPSTDDTYTVYGDLKLPCDITIPQGATVTIPNGASLEVPEAVTLTNNGTIQKDGGSFINDGTVTGQQPADDRYSIDYAEETITIAEGYSLYDAETGGNTIIAAGAERTASITSHIPASGSLAKTLYLQAPTSEGAEQPDRREITIPARPAAPTDTVTIDYANEQITTAPNTDTSNWEYSTSTTIWQDVPAGMALSDMGWDGNARKTYYFRTGATDSSFASSAATTTITAPARPEKPALPTAVEVTSNSITIQVVPGQEYRLGSSETWSTHTGTTGADGQTVYTYGNLTPGTAYTIETRYASGMDKNGQWQFASHPASITVTTERADSSLTVEPTEETLTYGDELEIKVTPGIAAANALATAENTVELYNGDKLLDSSTEADADGTYTLTYSTQQKGLTIGENTLTVSYGGSGSMNPSTAAVNVTLNKKSVTAQAVGPIIVAYTGDTSIMVSLNFAEGVLIAGDDIEGAIPSDFVDPNVGANKPIILGTTPIWLSGGDAAQYYDITLPTNVTGDITTASIDGELTILGTAQYGQTLTASYTGDASVIYQWKRDGEAIENATSNTYELTEADIGKAITVTVTTVAGGNYDGNITSAPITVGKAAGSIEISCGDVTYGTAVNPIVTSTTNEGADVTYSYEGTGGTSYGPISEAPENVGTYTVTATVAETATHTAATSEPVTFTISKAGLAAPQNLSLTSTAPGKATAAWEEVQNASGYTVQLYKDGQADGAPTITTGTSCEFSIAEAGSYGDGTYHPEKNITREQLAVIFYNYAKLKGYDVSAANDLSGFTDAGDVSDWALPAMRWAVGSGIMGGYGDGILGPQGTATRAQVAAMLCRFIENNKLVPPTVAPGGDSGTTGTGGTGNGGGGWTQQKPVPQTGDNSNIGLWFSLCVLSFAGIVGTLIAYVHTKRRREDEENPDPLMI